MPQSDDQLSILRDERYKQLLETTKRKIVSTRINAAKAVCREQMDLYWWLGQQVVKAQKDYGWGRSIVEQLSQDLAHVFPESKFGFSPRNLWDMRRFYLEYKDHPELRQLVAEIPWGHNLLIINKIKYIEAKKYYLNAVNQRAWTRDMLTQQIKSQAYDRHMLSTKQHNFEEVLPAQLAIQADQALKDVYLFETLGLTQPVVEAEMEARMVSKIKDVMLEFGYGFTFIANQYRLVSPSGKETIIDLLFFNRRLRALVAVELKVGGFKPEYAGRMNYRLNLLDDLVKEPWENPSIGIILCSERDRIDVEYALRGIDKPMGVAEFQLTPSLPSELTDKLPNPKELEAKILRELGG